MSQSTVNPSHVVGMQAGAFGYEEVSTYRQNFTVQEPQSDVMVKLCDDALWSRFDSVGTEMVLTKVGR